LVRDRHSLHTLGTGRLYEPFRNTVRLRAHELAYKDLQIDAARNVVKRCCDFLVAIPAVTQQQITRSGGQSQPAKPGYPEQGSLSLAMKAVVESDLDVGICLSGDRTAVRRPDNIAIVGRDGLDAVRLPVSYLDPTAKTA
jgi:hypothetical protein